MSFRIEFDYQIFSLQRYGGISRYFAEVAARLAARPGLDVSIHCPFYVNEYLRNMPESLVRGRMVREMRRTGRLRHWINGKLAGRSEADPAVEIRHQTYYGEVKRSRLTQILTVHDMAHEKFPECFPAGDRTSREKKLAVERADAIICISRNTRQDLLEILPVDPRKVHVTHLAYSPMEILPSYQPPEWMRAEPFFLFVGIRSGYKNFLKLIKAYGDASRALSRRYRLACLGGGAFTAEEGALINSLGLAGRIRQFSAEDALIAYAYSRAHALVYPSIYEGFGIPPLEAMASGCPVVCGRNSSLDEVVGDAACIIDPMDENSIADGLEKVSGSEIDRTRFIDAGRLRAAAFSWDKCAEETLAIYRQTSDALKAT